MQVHVADYLGATHFIGATLERAGIVPDPSMAQVRQVRRSGHQILAHCLARARC